ncbi:MAG: sugar ABC transporter substrate-binding protein [Planctomycetaceae bacterium]|nr:sugar ABC transporter substrate-binding protein [Planctomycetaceae bacterium]
MTRWHRSFLLFALVAVCQLVSGCGENTESSGATNGDSQNSDKPRIALIMKSLGNEFFATMENGAYEHNEQHAEQYELISNGIQNETDLSAQVSLVEQMVAQRVDAIVIAPADSEALVPVLKRAIDEGIVVINIDNKLDATMMEQLQVRIPFVGPDNRAGARKVGDYLAGQLQSGDQVAVLEGIETSFNGQQRKLGFEEAMQAANITIADSQSAQWELSVANTTAAGMLIAHPEIKAILACNDSMALGAVAAVRAAGRDDVKVVGFDNIHAAQEAIRSGQLIATADQHGDQLAVFGIEYALQAMGGNGDALQDRETPVDLVTADSLR